jgi:hypothetical protein
MWSDINELINAILQAGLHEFLYAALRIRGLNVSRSHVV